METKFRELHFRGLGALHKMCEFYLSDHGRQPHFGQNSISARNKAKIKNWKIINCVFIYMYQTLFTDKSSGKIILVPKSSGPLLAGLPLNQVMFHQKRNAVFWEMFVFQPSEHLLMIKKTNKIYKKSWCTPWDSNHNFSLVGRSFTLVRLKLIW